MALLCFGVGVLSWAASQPSPPGGCDGDVMKRVLKSYPSAVKEVVFVIYTTELHCTVQPKIDGSVERVQTSNELHEVN